MKATKVIVLSSILSMVLFSGCKKGDAKDFLFPVEKDIELGQQLADYIDTHPEEYPLVDSTKNPQLYQAMYHFRDVILNSGKVNHKDKFAWKIKVINGPDTQNAFAAPGGFIYIYTGIINYLDKPEHFAGVMGHELAHAAERHSVNQMIKTSGLQVLLEVTLGSESGLADLATGLASLKFSRKDESDADEKSIEYLCGTQYESNGAAGFFEKLIADEATGSTPEFLSTHPSPENRVEDINTKANEMGCSQNGEKISWTNVKTLASNIK
jgi:beta-barrel assembly-enhancing protease